MSGTNHDPILSLTNVAKKLFGSEAGSQFGADPRVTTRAVPRFTPTWTNREAGPSSGGAGIFRFGHAKRPEGAYGLRLTHPEVDVGEIDMLPDLR